MHGRTNTELARQALSKSLIEPQPYTYSTTGYVFRMMTSFNWMRLPRSDESLEATSSKYGKSAIPATHPGIRVGLGVSVVSEVHNRR